MGTSTCAQPNTWTCKGILQIQRVPSSGGEGLMARTQRRRSGSRRGGRDGAVGRGHRRGRRFGPACRLGALFPPKPGYGQLWLNLELASRPDNNQSFSAMWLALGQPLTGAIDAYPDWPRATWSGEVTREEAKPGILRRSLPAFNYPQTSFRNPKPRSMSVSRVSPRQSTMLPGGGSCARARYPPSFAICTR